MNIFPIKRYEIELLNDSSKALSELENNTMITDYHFSEWTKKAFIGLYNIWFSKANTKSKIKWTFIPFLC
ncbi:MAG: hypothetical protein ABI576_02525 [Flavobacterium sp.]